MLMNICYICLKMLLVTVVLASYLLHIFPVTAAQDNIGCFVQGKCIDSNAVKISFPLDPNGCLQVILLQLLLLIH